MKPTTSSRVAGSTWLPSSPTQKFSDLPPPQSVVTGPHSTFSNVLSSQPITPSSLLRAISHLAESFGPPRPSVTVLPPTLWKLIFGTPPERKASYLSRRSSRLRVSYNGSEIEEFVPVPYMGQRRKTFVEDS